MKQVLNFTRKLLDISANVDQLYGDFSKTVNDVNLCTMSCDSSDYVLGKDTGVTYLEGRPRSLER